MAKPLAHLLTFSKRKARGRRSSIYLAADPNESSEAPCTAPEDLGTLVLEALLLARGAKRLTSAAAVGAGQGPTGEAGHIEVDLGATEGEYAAREFVDMPTWTWKPLKVQIRGLSVQVSSIDKGSNRPGSITKAYT